MSSFGLRGVLVVEDDRDIRETFGEVLGEAGYEVSAAADGLDALEYLRRCARLPDAIVLDLMMPRMDGRQFRAEQIKVPEWADIPIIVISADKHVDETAGLGAIACLRKPVNLSKLLETIEVICARVAGSQGKSSKGER